MWKKYTNFDLPSDARTLLHTPRKVCIKQIEGGRYCHFGLAAAIESIVSALMITSKNVEKVDLMINIDGLPLSKSNKSSFWPIMCSDPRLESKVFLIGVFHGYEKPKCPNEFLKEFVDELVLLVNQGFTTSTGNVIRINLFALICDAPAKSFVLCIKGHTGYNSCSKCTIVGKYINGRICFPSPNEHHEFNTRTDQLFSQNFYEDYQNNVSVLNTIPGFGLVTGTPLDYLHLVCIGTMKKLIALWLEGPLTFRISSRDVKIIFLIFFDKMIDI